MHTKLQSLYQKFCTITNRLPLEEANQAGGPGIKDTADLDFSLLDLSSPHKVADAILNNLNMLAGRNVLL